MEKSISDITSLSVAIISLIVAIILGIVQYKQTKNLDKYTKDQDERSEKRHQDFIYSEAMHFIQKYTKTDEIQLLPNCIMAFKFNATNFYRREMYNEFCVMQEEIRDCILKQKNINLDCSPEKSFYDTCLEYFKLIFESEYGKDIYLRFFYENAKYFKYTLTISGRDHVLKNSSIKDKVHYLSYITDILSDATQKDPISILFEELYDSINKENHDSFDELNKFLYCMIVKWVSIYKSPGHILIFENADLNISNGNYETLHSEDWYMEDLFLDALLNLYVYQIKYKDFIPADALPEV